MKSGQVLERDRFSKVVICFSVALLGGVALLLATGSQAAFAAAADPYRIAYDNGVVVEVLAVSMVPSRGKPFWQPDGARLIGVLDVDIALQQVDDREVRGGLTIGHRGTLQHQPALRVGGMDTLVHQA